MTYAIKREESTAVSMKIGENSVTFGLDGKSAYIEEPKVEEGYQSALVLYSGADNETKVSLYTMQGDIIRRDMEFAMKGVDPAVLVEKIAKANNLEDVLNLITLNEIFPKAKFLLFGCNNN